VIVSDHCYLKPLLPLLTDNGRFYILAMSQNEIRLLEGTHYSVQQVELPEEVPESLAEALKYEEAENEVWLYSSSSGATIGKGGRRLRFYGQGLVMTIAKITSCATFSKLIEAYTSC